MKRGNIQYTIRAVPGDVDEALRKNSVREGCSLNNYVVDALRKNFTLDHKEEARNYFYKLRHSFIDWNYKEWNSGEFKQGEERIDDLLSKPVHEVSPHPSLEQAKKG